MSVSARTQSDPGPTATGRPALPLIGVHHAGMLIGALVGGWHLIWAFLIAIGLAQPLVNFVFWMHMIKPVYLIEPFSLARAVLLIVFTAVFGYVIGGVFALLWNRARR